MIATERKACILQSAGIYPAEGLPLMHTVHPGNVTETKTLQAMLSAVLERYTIEQVILVADRGLLSPDNIDALTRLAEQGGRTLEFILALPARRYSDLVETFRNMTFEDGLAEARFADHRLIVAHDPVRAVEQDDRRRAHIVELEAMAEKMTDKIQSQDEGKVTRGRRASVRIAQSGGRKREKMVLRYTRKQNVQKGRAAQLARMQGRA